MKCTKINFAYPAAAFIALSVLFISCNGNNADKQESGSADTLTVMPADTPGTPPNPADTIKTDSSRTEQNPPAIRRPPVD